jgi:hypothetical protein
MNTSAASQSSTLVPVATTVLEDVDPDLLTDLEEPHK